MNGKTNKVNQAHSDNDNWREEWDQVGEAAYDPFNYTPSPNGKRRVSGRFSVRSMADVVPRSVEWLWRDRIPFGKITNLEGDPENGKSLVSTDFAARTSKKGGAFPDGEPCPQCGVLLICDEDDYEDTIVPRLIAAGADRRNIFALHPEKNEIGDVIPFFLPDNIPDLEDAIASVRKQTALRHVVVVVDPASAYLSEKINSGVDASVRRATSPLAELARETGAAMLLVRHLNKNTSEKKVAYRGGGSIGFFAAARAVFVFGPHPDDPSRIVMAQAKRNLSRAAPSLAYRILSWDEDPNVPIVEWEPEPLLNVDASAVLNGRDSRKDSPKKDLAKDLLNALLDENDGWVRADYAIREAKRAGISKPTLDRAADDLGLVRQGVRREEGDGGEKGLFDHWLWRRPVQGKRVHMKLRKHDD